MDRVSTPVFVVDDRAPFRSIARTVISVTQGVAVAGEAALGAQALRLAAELAPEGMLMDIDLPRLSGLEATRRIVAAPDTWARRNQTAGGGS